MTYTHRLGAITMHYTPHQGLPLVGHLPQGSYFGSVTVRVRQDALRNDEYGEKHIIRHESAGNPRYIVSSLMTQERVRHINPNKSVSRCCLPSRSGSAGIISTAPSPLPALAQANVSDHNRGPFVLLTMRRSTTCATMSWESIIVLSRTPYGTAIR